MEALTGIARGVVSSQRSLDAFSVRVVSEKQVMAHMLHDWTDEFACLSVDEIASKCLAEEPLLRQVPLDRDVTVSGRVLELATEDRTVHEGRAVFDVRTSATAPMSGRYEQVEIDVEIQNKANPGYSLPWRGEMYTSRMISQQGDCVLPHSNYELMRKVFSFWVVTEPPARLRGQVLRLRTTCVNRPNDCPLTREEIDRKEIVMAYLDNTHPGESAGALGLLEILFAEEMPVEEKLRLIEKRYGIIVTETFEKDVSGMCTYSQGVLERGREEGREEGSLLRAADAVERIMSSLGFTLDRALELLGLTHEEWEEAERLCAARALEL